MLPHESFYDVDEDIILVVDTSKLAVVMMLALRWRRIISMLGIGACHDAEICKN